MTGQERRMVRREQKPSIISINAQAPAAEVLETAAKPKKSRGQALMTRSKIKDRAHPCEAIDLSFPG